MSTQKIKFSVAIEKLTLNYEGDVERGEALQRGFNQTLANLANLQNQAMGLDAGVPPRKQIESTSTNPATPPARRRRRRRSAGASDADVLDGQADAGTEDDGASPDRRSTGAEPTARLVELKRSGYFAQPRTAGDVVEELHRTGFSSIRGSDLTSPFLRLVQKQVLQRERDTHKKQWVYTNGTKDDAE
jgi:hypothetical protein